MKMKSMVSRSVRLGLLIGSAGTFVLIGAAIASQATEEGMGAGRKDYVDMGCYQCHGYEGQGAGDPRIAPDPLKYEAFARIVRKPYGEMPAYSPKVLPDDKLQRIYEYVRSIPPPPKIDAVPLLRGK